MKDMNSFWFLLCLVVYGIPILLIFGAGYWLGRRKADRRADLWMGAYSRLAQSYRELWEKNK